MVFPRRRPVSAIVAAIALVGVIAGCDDDDDATPTADGYVAELEALCEETLAALDALPSPPEMITVEDFAAEAASLLATEAEAARRLQPPRDGGLDDDHRAFVRNTDEQATAWGSVGVAVADDALAGVTTRIGELVLGRDELVIEMGAPGCVRGGAALAAPADGPADRPADQPATTTAEPSGDSPGDSPDEGSDS